MSRVWMLQPKAEQMGHEKEHARLAVPSGLQRLAMMRGWPTSVPQTEAGSMRGPENRDDGIRLPLFLTLWTLPSKRAKIYEQHCHGEML